VCVVIGGLWPLTTTAISTTHHTNYNNTTKPQHREVRALLCPKALATLGSSAHDSSSSPPPFGRLPALLHESLAAQVSRCALHNPRRPTGVAAATAVAAAGGGVVGMGGGCSVWEEHRCGPAVLPQVGWSVRDGRWPGGLNGGVWDMDRIHLVFVHTNSSLYMHMCMSDAAMPGAAGRPQGGGVVPSLPPPPRPLARFRYKQSTHIHTYTYICVCMLVPFVLFVCVLW
jgi:hypothetical protein